MEAPPNHDLSLILGAFTIAGGIAATLVSLEAHAREDDLHQALEDAKKEPTSGSKVTDLQERTDNQALLANILWGTTLALAISTGVAYYLELEEEDNTLTFAPNIGDNAAGLTMQLRY